MGLPPGSAYSLNVSVLGSKRPIFPASYSQNQTLPCASIFRRRGQDCGRRLLVLGELPGLGVHFADLAVFREFREPHVFVLIESEAVGVGHFGEIVVGFGFGIEARQRLAGAPHHSLGVHDERVFRAAARFAVARDLVRRGIHFADRVGGLLGKPDHAVRTDHDGMVGGLIDIGNRVLGDDSGLGIELPKPVAAVLPNPDVAIALRLRGAGKAIDPGMSKVT